MWCMPSDSGLMHGAGFQLQGQYWLRHDGDYDVTISNGVSINGKFWEVQVCHADGTMLYDGPGAISPEEAMHQADMFMDELCGSEVS